MELKNLSTFIQVVESGSFSVAAKALGYTQSTVSFQIGQLEEELDCRLFDRINHRISLTEKGELLLAHAMDIRRSMQLFDENFNRAGSLKGTVRIVSSDSICEKMMLLNYHNFYNEYPEIKLIFSTANTDEMLRILDRNEADVIFTLDNHIYSREYIIAKESPVRLHFVAGTSSPLASEKDLDIKELLEFPFILTEKGMSYRRILDERLAQESIEINPVLEAGRTDIICSCLKNGNSISFLPDFVSEHGVREGWLAFLDVKDFDLMIWKQLIYHRNKWLSEPLLAFLEFVKSHEFTW